VPVVLGLGTGEDLVALAREDGLDAGAQLRERVQAADRRDASGQGDVDGAGRPRGGGQGGGPCVERLLDLALEGVDRLPQRGPLLGGGGGERLHQRRNRAPLAPEIAVADGLEIAVGAGGRDLAGELCAKGVGRGQGTDCSWQLAAGSWQ